jgi:hypothetical protein
MLCCALDREVALRDGCHERPSDRFTRVKEVRA